MKQLIDIARKGNALRFFLGEKTDDWGWTNPDYKDGQGHAPDWLKPENRYYGDDWDDTPFEHNAGGVYPWFVKDTVDVTFPFDSIIVEPNDGVLNSSYCMDDFVAREAPRFIVISEEAQKALYDDGKGPSAWAYEGDFEYARKLISEWESSHGEKLEGADSYYLGDVVEVSDDE